MPSALCRFPGGTDSADQRGLAWQRGVFCQWNGDDAWRVPCVRHGFLSRYAHELATGIKKSQ